MTERYGQTLRALRVRHQLSQPDLEAATGIDRRNLSQLELGKRRPSEANWAALATVFTPEEMTELRDAAARDLLAKKGLSPEETAGTSYAQPIIANVAAQMAASGMTPEEVRAELIAAAEVAAASFTEDEWIEIYHRGKEAKGPPTEQEKADQAALAKAADKHRRKRTKQG